MTGRDRDKEVYSKLLKEEVMSTRATWHEFRKKWKKDRRFFGWAGDRERERAFRVWLRDLAEGKYIGYLGMNNFILDMTLSVKKKQAEKAEREFFQLLQEHIEIKSGDVWKEVCAALRADSLAVTHMSHSSRLQAKRKIDSKDPRYDAVGSSSLREELFATYVKTVGDPPIQADKLEDTTHGKHQKQDDDAIKQHAERKECGLCGQEDKLAKAQDD